MHPELRVASHSIRQPFYSPQISEVHRERRVSPEASSLAKASEDIPRSFNEGESAKGDNVKYVYLLKSLSVPTQRYVGITTDLKERLRAHNCGASSHTSKYRPWKIVTYLCFEDDRRAAEFERYLKMGSGQAFANKHLW
jgi:putative endonuclease